MGPFYLSFIVYKWLNTTVQLRSIENHQRGQNTSLENHFIRISKCLPEHKHIPNNIHTHIVNITIQPNWSDENHRIRNKKEKWRKSKWKKREENVAASTNMLEEQPIRRMEKWKTVGWDFTRKFLINN